MVPAVLISTTALFFGSGILAGLDDRPILAAVLMAAGLVLFVVGLSA